MTKVTSKIAERYARYYNEFCKLDPMENHEKTIAYLVVLEILAEVLLNDCGLTKDKLDKIRMKATDEF